MRTRSAVLFLGFAGFHLVRLQRPGAHPHAPAHDNRPCSAARDRCHPRGRAVATPHTHLRADAHLSAAPVGVPTHRALSISVRLDRRCAECAPAVDPTSGDLWQVDLRGVDLRHLDVSDAFETLLLSDFDTRTRWPDAERMLQEYDPQVVLDLGKAPGLGLRRLHAQGITGRNVGIAIIDQTLLVDLQEYADRLQVYEETDDIQGGWLQAQMHGPAVASIAVGQTVGVAPEADLYYIASAMCSSGTHESIDFACLAESVYRVLEINKQLLAERQIRVLSMLIGWSPGDAGYDEIQAAALAAKEAGLLLICSSVEDVHGFRLHGLGRTPFADPNDFEIYTPGLWWAEQFYAGQVASGTLLVPMDSRTTASPAGSQDCAFYRSGGWSWSIPYIAGAYALAAQSRPDITPDAFWRTALRTGTTIEIHHDGRTLSLGPILNPEALIAALRAP
jgi:hypothetical protein